jgi:hypothetical protein
MLSAEVSVEFFSPTNPHPKKLPFTKKLNRNW